MNLYCIASAELLSYLNAESRLLIQSVVNLWAQYVVRRREFEADWTEALATLDGFLDELGYLK